MISSGPDPIEPDLLKDIAPVERKVTAATLGTYVGLTALLAVLNIFTDPDLRSNFPGWVEVFVFPMFPSVITFVSGYLAKHTPRV